jgi:hypothetical protein
MCAARVRGPAGPTAGGAPTRGIRMSTRLRDHLLSEHGRELRDLDGLPLAGVHRLEQVEDELGLLQLDHGHAHASARRRRRPGL